MHDDDQIARNLVAKQDAFFCACESAGYTLKALAAKLGVKPTTLQTYKPVPSRATTHMPLTLFIRIAKAMPAEISSLLIEDADGRFVRNDPEQANWDALAAEAAGLVADVCIARSDGSINHQEDARLRERTRKLIAEAQGAVQP